MLHAVHEGSDVASQEDDTEVPSLNDIAVKRFNREPDEDQNDGDGGEMIPRLQTGEQNRLGCKFFPTL
jgi:hypothetical protein